MLIDERRKEHLLLALTRKKEAHQNLAVIIRLDAFLCTLLFLFACEVDKVLLSFPEKALGLLAHLFPFSLASSKNE